MIKPYENEVYYFTFTFLVPQELKFEPYEVGEDIRLPPPPKTEEITIRVEVLPLSNISMKEVREEAYKIAKREFDAKYNNKAKGSPD